MESKLGQLRREIQDLKLGIRKSSKKKKPHKLCLLLAVLDMADEGRLRDNCISRADKELTRYFEKHFRAYDDEGQDPDIDEPFIHLEGPLWSIHARLDRDFFDLLQDGVARQRLRECIRQELNDRC